MLKAINIQWDFDKDEIIETIHNYPIKDLAKILDINEETIKNLTTEEKEDIALSKFRRCPALLDEFMGLPNEVFIPEKITQEEDISDWLSDEYGFCHWGFEISDGPEPACIKILCPRCGKELTADFPLEDEKRHFYCDCEDIDIYINPDEETPVSINNENIRTDWYNAGEGVTGDYDPDDPEDINLLRFDVYFNPEILDVRFDDVSRWEEVEDASYCTQIPAESSIDTLINSLWIIFKRYKDVIEADPYASVKKMGEELSWISPQDI